MSITMTKHHNLECKQKYKSKLLTLQVVFLLENYFTKYTNKKRMLIFSKPE